MKKEVSARYAAVEALVRCEKSGYSNLVLAQVLRKSGLCARDRAFASRIVYGTIEHRLTLEARLAPFLRQPLDTMPAELRCILRSGLYQCLYMDAVPVSAAVNESVLLARAFNKGSAAGFVNAVLRKASTAPFAPQFKTELERLSITYSVGVPIVRLLQKAYPTQVEQILATSFGTPPLAVRVNMLKTTPEVLARQLSQKGITVRETALSAALILEDAGDVTALDEFQGGLFHVQGIASQLAVRALTVQPGDRVLDLCAAPGGKSATIAQELCGQGSLVACELHENRLSLIRSLLGRIGATNVSVCQNDAAIYNDAFGTVDKVLCDVPCSGLGTIAKKPDIRYKDLAELPKLTILQQDILSAASRYLAPGGVLVYSTCTINPAENEQIVRAFLQTHSDFSVQPLELEQYGAKNLDGMNLFLPQKDGMDGFFIARLVKASV